MSHSRFERFLPLTGLVFVLLFIVSSISGSGDFVATPEAVVAGYTEMSRELVYLGILSGFFLLWFAIH